jgi:quercetin dioxygenase-like cupin family protein
MKVQHYTETAAEGVPGMPGVTVRWVIAEGDGAPHFAMRVFDVPAGAATEYHQHWWEHEIFVLAGRGHVRGEAGEFPLGEGTVAFIPGGEMHQLVNDGEGVLRFICLIPHPKLEGLARGG